MTVRLLYKTRDKLPQAIGSYTLKNNQLMKQNKVRGFSRVIAHNSIILLLSQHSINVRNSCGCLQHLLAIYNRFSFQPRFYKITKT